MVPLALVYIEYNLRSRARKSASISAGGRASPDQVVFMFRMEPTSSSRHRNSADSPSVKSSLRVTW